jgi:pimeloyl-ACP methyl ester carboxylesterase
MAAPSDPGSAPAPVGLPTEVRGDRGDALVLVHGSWVDRRTWDLVVPMLSQTFRVVRYDRRGYDFRSPSAAPYDFSADANDLVQIIEEGDLHPVHLVGHSLGGCVATRVAAERPELLRSLVVFEPPLLGLLDGADPDFLTVLRWAEPVAERVRGGDARGAAQAFADSFAGAPGTWDGLGRGTQELMVRYAGRWLAEFEEGRAFEAPPASLGDFLAPALVLSGQQTSRVYTRVADALAARLPNVVRQVLPRVGHLPHITEPGTLVGVLFSFCAERVVPTS